MRKTKPQILFIHGGMTFRDRKDYVKYLKTKKIRLNNKANWDDAYFTKNFSKKCQIIRPRMPAADNAKYEDWKLFFNRFIPHLRNNVILIGYSLGGIFLAKYLSENKFKKKILSVYLVAPPFDNTLTGENLVGGFRLKSDLSLIEKNCKNTTLMFSGTDDCVPISHAKKYRKNLKNAKIIVYKDKNGHFRTPKFPEIVKMIKKDLKRIKH